MVYKYPPKDPNLSKSYQIKGYAPRLALLQKTLWRAVPPRENLLPPRARPSSGGGSRQAASPHKVLKRLLPLRG